MAKMKFCNKPALVVGIYAALLHIIWALLVAVGVGQAYLDWIFPLHFISNVYTVIQFSLLNAVLLAVMAFIGGYIATLIFVWLWKIIKIK